MKGIVSNATPLIYLAKIGKTDLLKKVFNQVFIPEQVKTEAVNKGKKLGEKDAYLIEKAIKDGWLKVSKTKIQATPIKLEPGEAAVLSLAKKLGTKEVLIDELPARTAARLLGLTPRGTIYVLLKALEKKEINLNEFLEALRDLANHGFRLKEEVYIEAVGKAREITQKETRKKP